MVLRRRHLAKAITWRLGGSCATALFAWLLTHEYSIAFAMFVFDSIIKIVLYYVHERVWYRIKWGVKPGK